MAKRGSDETEAETFMKTKIGMFTGVAGAAVLATQAMAYVPPAGVTTTIKLTDATGFYVEDRVGGLTPAARGTTPSVGDQDLTLFRLRDIQEGSDPSFSPKDIGLNIGGVVTFLEYRSTFVPFVPGSPELGGTAQLGDSGRTHTVAVDPLGRATIGRFFVYERAFANDQNFDEATGTNADDITFDDFQDGYNIDTAPAFTTGTLLATGSIVDTFGDTSDGLITQFFLPSGQPGVELESIIGGPMVIDGGTWFDAGITQATFSIHLYTILSTVTDYNTIKPTPIREDTFYSDWLASSEDPITVFRSPIPEPVTAGLGFLALSGLASYVTARRKA